MIKPDGSGTVWASGDNLVGELGNSVCTVTSVGETGPVQVVNMTGAIAVAAGDMHSVALKNDGTVWAWGLDLYGQLGDNQANSFIVNGYNTPCAPFPVQVIGLSGIQSIAAAGYHSLAVDSSGNVWKWGSLMSSVDGIQFQPAQVTSIQNAAKVAAGYHHCLVLDSTGNVWTWGDNAYGQLGDGTTSARSSSNPYKVPLSGIVAIAAGNANSYALDFSGKVWAWGAGKNNGDGGSATDKTPVPVQNLSNVVDITAGALAGYAMENDNSVWAWGHNNSEIGNGSTGGFFSYQLIPARTTTTGFTPVSLATGSSGQFCLLTASDYTLRAWGLNGSGQLADGTTTTWNAPVLSVNLNTLLAPFLYGDTPNADDLTWTFTGPNPDHWRIEMLPYSSNGPSSWQFVTNVPGTTHFAHQVGDSYPIRIVGQDSNNNNVTRYSNTACTF
jgi:alpha-tubulin suppressor-like RCC1 family protein